MNLTYFEDEVYKHETFIRFPLGEYENCKFISCDFSDVDISSCVFLCCEFVGCNLSMVKIAKASFQEVTFSDCKMLGMRWDSCNPFGLSLGFSNCILSHTSFYKLKIKNTHFVSCQLQEVDFTDAELNSASFDCCDLKGAVFSGTNLERADFRTALNFSIDPEGNRIRKAKFSLSGLEGLLGKYGLEIDSKN
ncbi:MAG TPA: pentapeptide repeat-containing protein [Lunatimonas sp.]|nr:pentapeptide repeat-containing protein [Lunatimonas sp.]